MQSAIVIARAVSGKTKPQHWRGVPGKNGWNAAPMLGFEIPYFACRAQAIGPHSGADKKRGRPARPPPDASC
jgi:hypothetical protein